MASGLITSRQIDGETTEIVTDLIFLGSKIIADGDCSYKIKRRLLLGRKAMTNLDSILTNRDHSVVFEIATKYCISDVFVDHDGYSISSKGFLTTVVDIMVI